MIYLSNYITLKSVDSLGKFLYIK